MPPMIFVVMVLRMLFIRCGVARCLKKFGGRNHASGISQTLAKLAKLAKHSPCPRYWSDDIPLQICVYGQNKKSSTIVGTKQTSTSTYIIHPLLLTRALLCKAFWSSLNLWESVTLSPRLLWSFRHTISLLDTLSHAWPLCHPTATGGSNGSMLIFEVTNPFHYPKKRSTAAFLKHGYSS